MKTDFCRSLPYNTDKDEMIHLSHGGPVDVRSFAKQHKRVYDIRKACSDIASGRTPTRLRTISAAHWGDMMLVLRRRPNKDRQVRLSRGIIRMTTRKLTT